MMKIMHPPAAHAVRFGVRKSANISVELQGIDRGNSIEQVLGSPAKRAAVLVLDSQRDLDVLWKAPAFRGVNKPAVDFNKQAAVLTLLGENEEVSGVDYTNAGQLHVLVKPKNPMTVSAVMNYPWHLAVVDKGMVQTAPRIRQVPTFFP